MTIRISIGANREVLLKLAADIQSAFAGKYLERSLSLWGNENTFKAMLPNEVEISFSNEDMEGRGDLSPDAVFVDVEEV